MSVQIVKVSDFEKIASENEFFIWHFTTETRSLVLQPYHKIIPAGLPNPIVDIVDLLNLPYFESDAKESIDFLINLKDGFSKTLYRHEEKKVAPIICGFKRRKFIHSTRHEGMCHCTEGFLEVIGKTNPNFLKNYQEG